MMKNQLRLLTAALLAAAGLLTAWAQPRTKAAPTDLRVSANARYLEKRDGAPFFMFGDTGWGLWTRLSDEDVRLYLDDRQRRGFNVIGVQLTTGWINPAGPNSGVNLNGDLPFDDLDPLKFNRKYFDRVAWVMGEAARRGLYVALKTSEPIKRARVSRQITDEATAYEFGRLLGARLREHNQKIIWMVGFDEVPKGNQVALFNANAEGIADGVNGENQRDGRADYATTMMTFHIASRHSSSEFFHAQPWLDFNSIQTFKYTDLTNSLVAADYALAPVKPTVMIEPVYENDRHQTNITPVWNRRQAYWTLLAGGCGFVYGNAPIWSLGHIAGGDGGTDWKRWLDSTGVRQVMKFKEQIASYPWWELRPDLTIFPKAEERGAGDTQKTAAYSADGTLLLVYFPNAGTASVKLSRLAAEKAKAAWVRTTDNHRQDAGAFSRGETPSFSLPGGWEDGLLEIKAITAKKSGR